MKKTFVDFHSKKIHFLGIGGAGINPLARICLENKLTVTGSDNSLNDNQKTLVEKGAHLWIPHSVEHLQKFDLPDICVFSTAIPETNEEFKFLKGKQVKLWHRSDLLQYIAESFSQQIVISGTHGKTTTTALLAWLLEKAGINPSWVLGGIMSGLETSFGWNPSSKIFLFEGDESDQSFLKSNPHYGLVTSLEPDHLENYQSSFDVQIKKFQEFAQKSEFFICGIDCPNVEKHLAPFAKLTYGISEKADWRIDSQEQIFYKNTKIGDLKIPKAPGTHNSLNALGAIAIANEIGISPQNSLNYLHEFPGVYRRFEVVGSTKSGITIIDDYAHHPTEVKSAISCAKKLLKEEGKGGRLIVLFQPHLPTRLRDLWQEFSTCFNEADILMMNDLYIARGQAIEGINTPNLIKEIRHESLIYCEGKPQNMVSPTINAARPNDLILILGAGDITYIRETLLNELRQNET